MPGVCRYGINKLREHLDGLVKMGLTSIMAFGVAETLHKASDSFNHAMCELTEKILNLGRKGL